MLKLPFPGIAILKDKLRQWLLVMIALVMPISVVAEGENEKPTPGCPDKLQQILAGVTRRDVTKLAGHDGGISGIFKHGRV